MQLIKLSGNWKAQKLSNGEKLTDHYQRPTLESHI